MIDVKYGQLSPVAFERYFTFLVGKMYKILPMKEENCETLEQYIESLQVELIGNRDLVDVLVEEPMFISLLNIIQYFISNEYDVKLCKREVFRAISLIEQINTKYFKGGN